MQNETARRLQLVPTPLFYFSARSVLKSNTVSQSSQCDSLGGTTTKQATWYGCTLPTCKMDSFHTLLYKRLTPKTSRWPIDLTSTLISFNVHILHYLLKPLQKRPVSAAHNIDCMVPMAASQSLPLPVHRRFRELSSVQDNLSLTAHIDQQLRANNLKPSNFLPILQPQVMAQRWHMPRP
jgi:hypothetical protein